MSPNYEKQRRNIGENTNKVRFRNGCFMMGKYIKHPIFFAITGPIWTWVNRKVSQRSPLKSVIEDRDCFWFVPMQINLLRIGDLAIVTFAAETFTEIGMKVKSSSLAKYTLFASVSDGCVSYLHTAESHDEGGYEVDIAPLAYRYPGRFQAGCEKLVLDATEKQMERLWQ